MKKKRILVTGAAGFMGSHLSEYLANEGHRVFGLDNFSLGKPINVPKNIAFIKCDLTDANKTQAIIKKIKPIFIYHLAAWAHESLSQFTPKLITENNLNAFLNLLVPAINNGLKRIVFTSSFSVYGDQKPPFSEKMPPKPVDIYAVAKGAIEKIIEILSQVHGFEYTILRPHNVYGPRQALWDPYRNAVAIFINRIMKGLPPIIYGDGNQTRSFSYIDDVTPYLAKAGFLDDAKGEIINIGPREENTVNELAQIILETFKSKLKPIYVPDRPREVKHAYCTNSKAKGVLGYRTTVDLRTGVLKTIEWAKKIGPYKFQYLTQLELSGKSIPKTWAKKIL